MDKEYRYKMVRAMELIARTVNDEEVFMYWLTLGVADGDIADDTSDDELDYYTDDETFAELMKTFLTLMQKAKNGGLYADGVLSKGKRKVTMSDIEPGDKVRVIGNTYDATDHLDGHTLIVKDKVDNVDIICEDDSGYDWYIDINNVTEVIKNE